MPCVRRVRGIRSCRYRSCPWMNWPRPCAATRWPAPGPRHRSGPAAPEVLDDLVSLLVTDLDQLIVEVPGLPLHDDRRELPGEFARQSLIGWAGIVVQPADQAEGTVHRAVVGDDRVIGDLVGHQVSLLKSEISWARSGTGM